MGSKKPVTIDVRDEILEHLKIIERDMAWLARKTGIAYGTLYSCFTHRLFKLSQDNLDKINSVMGTNF